jgi:hypothetical protein
MKLQQTLSLIPLQCKQNRTKIRPITNHDIMTEEFEVLSTEGSFFGLRWDPFCINVKN